MLCINLYLNTPFSDILSSFSPDSLIDNNLEEAFSQSSDDLIKTSVEELTKMVLADASVLPSNKNKVIIEKLYDKGIFKLKDSVIKVEELMNISKNTIYMHIRNYKKKSK